MLFFSSTGGSLLVDLVVGLSFGGTGLNISTEPLEALTAPVDTHIGQSKSCGFRLSIFMQSWQTRCIFFAHCLTKLCLSQQEHIASRRQLKHTPFSSSPSCTKHFLWIGVPVMVHVELESLAKTWGGHSFPVLLQQPLTSVGNVWLYKIMRVYIKNMRVNSKIWAS